MDFLNNGLYEPWIQPNVAQLKENLGADTVYRLLRWYKMYMARYGWIVTIDGREKDVSRLVEYATLFNSRIVFVRSQAYGLLVGTVSDKDLEGAKRNPNKELTKVTVTFKDGTTQKCTVGKDCVIMESDVTGLPPFLYLLRVALLICEKEDIINQQDNMLRKPIVIAGEGEELDNALNNLANVMSGVAGFNYNPKKKGAGKGNILAEKAIEVLNLQVGNAYKGSELWDSRKHYEEFICDYLGYTTVKNEKKERMNTNEVVKDNSIGQTVRKSADEIRERAVKETKSVLGIDIKLIKRLEEVEENGQDKSMEKPSNSPNDESVR